MDLRNRDHRNGTAADVREDILLETNFDEDGALTLAHTINPHTANTTGREQPYKSADKNTFPNTQNPLLQRSGFMARRNNYRSDTSIDRYSEYSLHGRRDPGLSLTRLIPNHLHILCTTTHSARMIFIFYV